MRVHQPGDFERTIRPEQLDIKEQARRAVLISSMDNPQNQLQRSNKGARGGFRKRTNRKGFPSEQFKKAPHVQKGQGARVQ